MSLQKFLDNEYFDLIEMNHLPGREDPHAKREVEVSTSVFFNFLWGILSKEHFEGRILYFENESVFLIQ